MSYGPDLSGLEPQTGTASPDGRRTYTPLEGDDAPPTLTGLAPELGGSRRVTTDPRLIALVLTTANRLDRERALRCIRETGQTRMYARELASTLEGRKQGARHLAAAPFVYPASQPAGSDYAGQWRSNPAISAARAARSSTTMCS